MFGFIRRQNTALWDNYEVRGWFGLNLELRVQTARTVTQLEVGVPAETLEFDDLVWAFN